MKSMLGTVAALAAVAVLGAAGVGPAQAQPKPKVATKAQITAFGQHQAKVRSGLAPRTVGLFLRRSAGLESGSFGVAATAAVPAEGSYVVYANRVYQIVGGAPLWVTSLPKGTKTTTVSQNTFENVLRWYPADGTLITASSTRAAYVIVGGAPVYISSWAAYPAGSAAKARVVNQLLIDHTRVDAEPYGHLTPWPMSFVWASNNTYTIDKDLFVTAKPSGRVFKIVGGSPQYVSSWATFGGAKRTITVTDAAMDRAGQSGVWANVLSFPYDGWPVQAAGTSPLFSMLGGAPVYVATPAAAKAMFEGEDQLGLPAGWRPSLLSQTNIDNGGQTGVWSHLNFYPADYYVAVGYPSGTLWGAMGGSVTAIPADEWEYGLPWNGIDDVSVANAGAGGVWNHLKPAPVDPAS